tara:strand:- start:72459 stop:73364 length:906 start_codon:yes stop_codon:yes gene_type:complete
MTTLSLPAGYADQVARLQSALQAAFDRKFELKTEEQRSQVEALLSRIGTVDWESEGFKSPENQRDLSIKFSWGHNHRFNDELSVDGRMRDRHVQLVAEFMTGFGLAEDYFSDQSVLDVGCWTGGTTLMLKLLGAGAITAVDEVKKYADTAHILARQVYAYEDVEARHISLYNLEQGTFDRVYVPGVVYHLSDPVLGLRRLFNRLRDGGEILVESAGIKHEEAMCWFKGNSRHNSGTEKELNRGGWAWYWPSAACLESWLVEAGFDEIRVFHSDLTNRVFGHARRLGHREITRAGLSVPDIE